MATIKVKLTNNAEVPVKGSEDAAAYDLKCIEETTIINGETKIVKTGIRMAIPKGYYGQILSRSGLASKGIFTLGGVIDSDYRGDIGVIIHNESNDNKIFKVGEKVAQIAIIKLFEGTLEVVNELDETIRNESGFGSTGL